MSDPQNNEHPFRFRGFKSPNYTNFPDEAIDELMPILSGAEWKVLSYVIRRTFGFKKDSDNISFSQICNGITTKEGKVLDQGTGLSKSTAQLAVKGLLEKEIIIAIRRSSRERGNEASCYSLNLQNSQTPYTENRYSPPMPEIGTALYRKSVTQQTVIQKTDSKASKLRKASMGKNQEEDTGVRIQGGSISREYKEPKDQEKEFSYSNAWRMEQPRSRNSSTNGNNARQEILGGFETAATVIQRQYRRSQATTTSKEERDAIRAYITDFARQFRDEAKLSSSVTRAVHIYEESGLSLSNFISKMMEAKSVTQESSQNIKKQNTKGQSAFPVTNKMPYYFAVLRDKCGLKKEKSN